MKWQPIETAPKNGTYVIVAGDSGYTTTPLRAEICRYDAEYRPRSPWVNHANDCFTDGGPPPTLWMPLPNENDKRECPSCEVELSLYCSHCQQEFEQ